jgi:hypothetical protein
MEQMKPWHIAVGQLAMLSTLGLAGSGCAAQTASEEEVTDSKAALIDDPAWCGDRPCSDYLPGGGYSDAFMPEFSAPWGGGGGGGGGGASLGPVNFTHTATSETSQETALANAEYRARAECNIARTSEDSECRHTSANCSNKQETRGIWPFTWEVTVYSCTATYSFTRYR